LYASAAGETGERSGTADALRKQWYLQGHFSYTEVFCSIINLNVSFKLPCLRMSSSGVWNPGFYVSGFVQSRSASGTRQICRT
jgi:hypothetical protein